MVDSVCIVEQEASRTRYLMMGAQEFLNNIKAALGITVVTTKRRQGDW